MVYTGNGKGKTSACIGQAIRALGQGMSVAFGQFMKRPGQAGEQKILAQLLGSNFMAGGIGFLRDSGDKALHREKALELAAWAEKLKPDMLILDEAIYALNYGLLEKAEILAFMDKSGHLVLSGRDAPAWLVDRADMVTEMGLVKHHFGRGIPAMAGIEF